MEQAERPKRPTRRGRRRLQTWLSVRAQTPGADTGSGSGGGAIEARFKPLEEENAKLQQEMGSISTAVTEIGTNMNAGFQ